jgi:ketosteroid isomerase-like protein
MDAKQQMRTIMESMTNGDLRPFFDAMSDDVTWQWMGVTNWSKTFKGKKEVVDDLFGGVARDLIQPFSVQLRSILADGDDVVVEHTGRNTTPDGRQYNNNYCWIFHFRDGFIVEVREYMDTELVTETFTG